jgi:hypothetical protein
MRKLTRRPTGTVEETLGTIDTIFLDGRRKLSRLLTDAEYHRSARSWPGFVLYRASHLREPWTILHRQEPPALALPTLSDWSIVPDPRSSIYDAPEIRRLCLHGLCSGGPFDRQTIITSPIRSVDPAAGTVTTQNSTYYLLEPAPAYESAYPNAKARLFAQEQIGHSGQMQPPEAGALSAERPQTGQ